MTAWRTAAVWTCDTTRQCFQFQDKSIRSDVELPRRRLRLGTAFNATEVLIPQ
jgi:hypothetical protein